MQEPPARFGRLESTDRIGRQNSSNSVDSERHIKGNRLSNISHHKEDIV